MTADTKECPFCGETIKVIAKKCRHCGEFLGDYTRDKVWQEINTDGGTAIGKDVDAGRDFVGRDFIKRLSMSLNPRGGCINIIIIQASILFLIAVFLGTMAYQTPEIQTGARRLVAEILERIERENIPPTPVVLPTPILTFTPTPVPTATPTPTATPIPTATPTTAYLFYAFETGTENWITSEGEFKLASLDTTEEVAHSGTKALQLITEFRSTTEDIYRHTEAIAYFANALPEGAESSGPYNLTGKSVSCFVYLPSGLVSTGDFQAYIRIFVKDLSYRNQFSNSILIAESNVNQWSQLTLTVGEGSSMDTGFDSTQISALGVRIDVPEQATLDYTGPLYIDDCAIQYQ